eukprot:m.26660 g.26660  ORF g.26660 m.26660 type:complete len:64 (-) comp38795_c0_seq2:886-1077(-)
MSGPRPSQRDRKMPKPKRSKDRSNIQELDDRRIVISDASVFVSPHIHTSNEDGLRGLNPLTGT